MRELFSLGPVAPGCRERASWRHTWVKPGSVQRLPEPAVVEQVACEFPFRWGKSRLPVQGHAAAPVLLLLQLLVLSVPSSCLESGSRRARRRAVATCQLPFHEVSRKLPCARSALTPRRRDPDPWLQCAAGPAAGEGSRPGATCPRKLWLFH